MLIGAIEGILLIVDEEEDVAEFTIIVPALFFEVDDATVTTIGLAVDESLDALF